MSDQVSDQVHGLGQGLISSVASGAVAGGMEGNGDGVGFDQLDPGRAVAPGIAPEVDDRPESVANAVVMGAVVVALSLVIAGIAVVYMGRDARRSGSANPVVNTNPTTTLRRGVPLPSPPGLTVPGAPASTIWMTWQASDRSLQIEFPGQPIPIQLTNLINCVPSAIEVKYEQLPLAYYLTFGDITPGCAADLVTTEFGEQMTRRSPDRQPANLTQSTFRGHPMTAFDLVSATGARAGGGVMIVTPRRLFVLTASGPSGATDLARFVNSLRFTL